MENLLNVDQFREKAKEILPGVAYGYLESGGDDLRTFRRNYDYFKNYQIRPRRMVDVRNVDTQTTLFGKTRHSPIVICPVGIQALFHEDGEIATAKAAQNRGHLMMASTVSNFPYEEIAKHCEDKPWFQLYPTTNRKITKTLLEKAEGNGCEVVVLTIDVPVPGNREGNTSILTGNDRSERLNFGNIHHLISEGETFYDPSVDWGIMDWLRGNTKMKIVLKGIMTAKDTKLALDHGADGIVVSNHGGRQLESDLSTIEVLEEIAAVAKGKIPILFDGGIRRGTDIFKALALGADAVCIGRAFIYGLAVGGQKGVERILEILQTELVRNMQIAGVRNLTELTSDFVRLDPLIRKS